MEDKAVSTKEQEEKLTKQQELSRKYTIECATLGNIEYNIAIFKDEMRILEVRKSDQMKKLKKMSREMEYLKGLQGSESLPAPEEQLNDGTKEATKLGSEGEVSQSLGEASAPSLIDHD